MNGNTSLCLCTACSLISCVLSVVFWSDDVFGIQKFFCLARCWLVGRTCAVVHRARRKHKRCSGVTESPEPHNAVTLLTSRIAAVDLLCVCLHHLSLFKKNHLLFLVYWTKLCNIFNKGEQSLWNFLNSPQNVKSWKKNKAYSSVV